MPASSHRSLLAPFNGGSATFPGSCALASHCQTLNVKPYHVHLSFYPPEEFQLNFLGVLVKVKLDPAGNNRTQRWKSALFGGKFRRKSSSNLDYFYPNLDQFISQMLRSQIQLSAMGWRWQNLQGFMQQPDFLKIIGMVVNFDRCLTDFSHMYQKCITFISHMRLAYHIKIM